MKNQNKGTYFLMLMVLSSIFDFFFLYFGSSTPSVSFAFFLIRKVELRLLLKRMLLSSLVLVSSKFYSILLTLRPAF